jgi:signal transduction histidine kinase/ligand-binding sensor domain-containing protein
LKKVVYILILIAPLFLQAQQYRFIPFNVSNGLSQNSVHSIFQDSDGLLWIGTQDGLNSFDGHNFKTYRHNRADTTTISDQFILSISEDKAGYLWVGTGNGLNRINRRTGKVQRFYLDPAEQNRISSNYPQIIRNKNGEVFFRHYVNPIFIDGQGQQQKADSFFRRVFWGEFDNQGFFWGLNYTNKNFFKTKSVLSTEGLTLIRNAPTEVFNPKLQYKFKIDINNTIWLYPTFSKGAVYFYLPKENTWHKLNTDIPAVINDVLITKKGVGWISAMDGIHLVKGYTYSGKIKNTYANTNALPAGSILTAFEDNQHNIWVGSANSGFAYYNPAFDNYNLFQTGVVSDAVTTAIDAANNTRWAGTTNGLLMLSKNSNEDFAIQKHLFTGKRITSLTKDKQNNIWAAVQDDGLYILNAQGTTIKTYRQIDSLTLTNGVLYLFCDSKNRVFVCTETGYCVFTSTDNWASYYLRNQQPVTTGWYILNAFEDKQKNIWLSKHLGIDVLDSNLNKVNEFLSATSTSPISRTLITACTQDDKGQMWIATLNNGIYLYDGKGLKQYTTANGLNSNVIYGLLTDDKGRIWATTTSGINVFVPNENKFYQLTVNDGLPSNDFLLGAFFKGENGELLAGSSKGLISIDANRITPETKRVAARLSDFKINGQSVESLANSFVINPGYKTIGFAFAVNESLQPKNIFFQYRLLGVDDKWSTLSADNPSITFSKLPYKKLSLEIRAAYALPDMEAAPVEKYFIDVKAPFTQKTWFRILAGLFLLTLVAFIVQQYNKAKYRKQLQVLQTQKELQQERNRISRDLHDNIGAYTSALIAGINQLKANPQNKEQQFLELNEYASNIMGYLRETIWVLSNEQLTLTAFTDRFKNYATRIVKNYPSLSVAFAVDIKNEKHLHPQVSLNLFRILQEALQNACKHSGASEITVEINSETKMQFSVTDNGKGITETARNDSYGLKNMQARAAESGFEIVISSVNSEGTQVTLKEK